MQTTHTPGPWTTYGQTVWSEHESVSGPVTKGQRTNHVCAVSERLKMPDAERKANARLIAAAPELLAACQAALDNLAPLYCDDHIVMKLLRSAIDKALPWTCDCGETKKSNAHWCNGCNTGRPSSRQQCEAQA